MGETQTTLIRPVAARQFLWAALFWLIAGGLAGFKFDIAAERFFYWKCFFLFGILCVLNLFFLGKTVASLLLFVSHSNSEKKQDQQDQIVPLFVWGSLKFLSLGGIIVSLVMIENPPGWSLYLGVGTMVAVPVIGGALAALKKAPEIQ